MYANGSYDDAGSDGEEGSRLGLNSGASAVELEGPMERRRMGMVTTHPDPHQLGAGLSQTWKGVDRQGSRGRAREGSVLPADSATLPPPRTTPFPPPFLWLRH